MKRLRVIGYCFKQGMIGLWENRIYSLVSVVTICVSLYILGAFQFLFANLNRVMTATEENVGITVFFNEGTTEERILQIRSDITGLEGVISAVYISPEVAWEEYKSEHLSPEVAETFGDDNPLKDSASIVINISDVSYQKELVYVISAMRDVRKINYSEAISDRLAGIEALLYVVSSVVIFLLTIVAFFLIRTTISTGINVRREELSVMSFIGATDTVMELPFVIEGTVIGIVGSIIPIVLLKVSYGLISDKITNAFFDMFGSIQMVPANTMLSEFVPIGLLFGIGIGLLGSWITTMVLIQKISVENF